MAKAFDRIYLTSAKPTVGHHQCGRCCCSSDGGAIAGIPSWRRRGSTAFPPARTATQPHPHFRDQPATAPMAPTVIISASIDGCAGRYMALVASPRLPLFDLASQDCRGVVGGKVRHVVEVGSAVDLGNPSH